MFVMKSTDTTAEAGNGNQFAITFTTGCAHLAISKASESSFNLDFGMPRAQRRPAITVTF